ncbi:MAG: ATP-dependent DNA helicase, partial [Bacteroidaceae bacterium]|nr:ATP-dependent DNA helicase [Bacteroidaceae bacterium]
VFVTGMEDALFPGVQAHLFPNEMEEERRLFYVAVTRAKRFCHLSFARSRYRYGNLEFSDESPFIREIESHYLQEEGYDTAQIESGISDSLRRVLFSSSEAPSASPVTSMRPTIAPKPKPAAAAAPRKPLQRIEAVRHKPSKGSSTQGLAAGCTIDHERFGTGTVIEIEGHGDDAKATVDFAEMGRKKLLLKFAKFTVVNA